jgi:hypothetical protein
MVGARRRRRSPGELFFLDSFSHSFDPVSDNKYAKAFEMVRIAPSSGNLQPWRAVVAGDEVHFFSDFSDSYGGIIRGSLKWVDIGIAMCHFELALWEQGIKGSWKIKEPENIDAPQPVKYVATWVPECKDG